MGYGRGGGTSESFLVIQILIRMFQARVYLRWGRHFGLWRQSQNHEMQA